jgi:hypothetical protein
VNVSGQQSLVLAGEYLPATRVAPEPPGSSLVLPSGGAVLQRVTVFATQPDSTVVLLRADYSAPLATLSAGTYESLTSRSAAGTQNAVTRDDSAIDAETASDRPASPPAAHPSTASLYARTPAGRVPQAAVKGGFIDVHA